MSSWSSLPPCLSSCMSFSRSVSTQRSPTTSTYRDRELVRVSPTDWVFSKSNNYLRLQPVLAPFPALDGL